MPRPEFLRDGRLQFSAAAGALWLAATLYLTMRTVGWIQVIPFWAFFTEWMAGVDVVQNVILFAPMGWIAHRAGWPFVRTVLVGLLVSGGIEFTQQWVPGRTTTAMDLTFNTTGAAVGWIMATHAVRPRLRLVLSGSVVAAGLWLHALNTSLAELVEWFGGSGVWAEVDRRSCPVGTPEQTVCLSVPNTAKGGNKAVAVGSGKRTYAHVTSTAFGRLMGRGDCVLMKFENTRGFALRLRPPKTLVCALTDTTQSTLELRVDPRLERTTDGRWVPTRIGAWMWPVWPFEAYRPAVLCAVASVAAVLLAALFAGTAGWVVPAGYLLVLEGGALITGMRGPGVWEITWAVVGWMLAVGAVTLDGWWRGAVLFR